jgi:hypothetical protein
MDEKTATRIGIVASIVGAVGAIAYLLSKPPAGGVQGAAGIPGPAGAPGIGIPGTAWLPGMQQAAEAPAGAGAPGAPAATVAEVTPSGSTLNQYFVSQFFPAGTDSPYTTGAINSNLGPNLDLMKRYAADAAASIAAGAGNGAGNGSCGGCKGSGGRGGGCGGGSCPNTPGPLLFPDGQGSCASTTQGRLIDSMNRCESGVSDKSLSNMLGNVGWWPQIPGIIPEAKFASILAVPPSMFGAS